MGVIPHLTQTMTWQKAAAGTNSIGEEITTYTTTETFRGRLRPMTGSMKETDNRKMQFFTHRIYAPILAIKPNDRISYAGQTYKVVYVSNVMSFGRFLQIDCELIT